LIDEEEMTDQEFLWRIHERLVKVHNEIEMVDYMHHLRYIIIDTDPKQKTSGIVRGDTDPNLMRKMYG
jgi:hypothetical protein